MIDDQPEGPVQHLVANLRPAQPGVRFSGVLHIGQATILWGPWYWASWNKVSVTSIAEYGGASKPAGFAAKQACGNVRRR